ncbi:hypothetical protein M5D96_001975, partial [Drosophila gunungcola]
MQKQTAITLMYGIVNLLIDLATSDTESSMPDNMNAILIKCPKNSSNKSCETQLIINLHMNPSFDMDKTDKFWVVDKVYEPSKGTISKIMSPYLIVVSRGEPVVMYPLQFLKTIKHDEIEKKPLEEFNNIKDSPSCKPDERQLEPSIEIGNTSRSKRNYLPGYARGKSIVSHFLTNERQAGPRQGDKQYNDQPPKDISSLGLVQVMDPTNEKNRLETPTQFMHFNKDIGSYDYDGQENQIKSDQRNNQDKKIEDRSKSNQIENDLRENALDDSDIQFSNKDLKNHKQQHIEERPNELHKTMEISDFESIPDFLLYKQMAQAEKRKHIPEKIEHDFKEPDKSVFNENDFQYDKDNEDFHYKLSSNSLCDLNDLSHENEYEHLKKKHFPVEKEENDINNHMTLANGKSIGYDFPLGRKNEKNYLKSSNSDLFNANDFFQTSKHFKTKPLMNVYNYERDNKKNKFKSLSEPFEYAQKSKKDNFNSRAPVNDLSSVNDFPPSKVNMKKGFPASTHSLSDFNEFSNEIYKNDFNFKAVKPNNLGHSLFTVNDFVSDKEKLDSKNMYSYEFPLERNNVDDFL